MAEITPMHGEAQMALASARPPRVLVAENIGRSGVELLREGSRSRGGRLEPR